MTPNAVFWHQSMDGQWRFRTNNKGFRDERKPAYEKPRGTLRMLVLGDSHTAGFEVDQDKTFANILEVFAAAGYGGRGAQQVFQVQYGGRATYLENEGLRYSPDVIVVGFFANDYSDNARADLYQLVDGNLIVASNATLLLSMSLGCNRDTGTEVVGRKFLCLFVRLQHRVGARQGTIG